MYIKQVLVIKTLADRTFCYPNTWYKGGLVSRLLPCPGLTQIFKHVLYKHKNILAR